MEQQQQINSPCEAVSHITTVAGIALTWLPVLHQHFSPTAKNNGPLPLCKNAAQSVHLQNGNHHSCLTSDNGKAENDTLWDEMVM